MPIQLLPISLANQIAAGEVIERPASVVKELVENCLDAGASQISVDIEQGGRRRIRVRDNGGGIVKEELGLALSRHATSKIASLSDLEAIQSLGFRGEALASISSVSRLTLTSKTATQEQAWQAWVEGRDMQAELAPASHPEGTTVDAQDLFFNTPARRKFLRTDKTEFAHIDEVLRRIALARFGVRFSLTHNDKIVRQYNAVQEPEHAIKRVAQVCGSSFTDTALGLDEQTGPVRLWGWIAPAHACRHQADVQYFYVNGRMMRDRLLGHAVRQAYGDTLNDERTPSFVLYLELPAEDVDVNVHPAKHEVRFHQARQIHDFVLHCARQALSSARATAATEAEQTQHGYTASSEALTQQVRELQPQHREIFPTRTAPPEPAPTMPHPKPSLPHSVLQVVAQRFALIESEPLALLDLQRVQHAYLQQQLQQQAQVGLAGQPLLIPVKLTDTALLRSLVEIDAKQLARLGVRYEQSKRAVTILDVPSVLRQTDIATSIAALVERLQTNKEVFSWLAIHQVQADYSLTQAEHWLRCWQDQLNSNPQWLTAITLPTMPEPLR
ncbi:DNA mismatch repair endonuclease MutL [Pseudidiomarina gelatinasegens]|uniref:DNA mismatch repair protein MutL n=1 Tax=Pseudidiomarina gelatinasegens TaxID=2487740 RepID=A0A451GE59_9GAMM|nr:DNA mismatch repair endonuclease MutL [Pseudidiomarina gelatinasegens]RWU11227.1 DNA mismatch repair endonuclease MutL [Pseudidiomarina gelatinasegens]